jgi:biotin carboxyl carrier protein
MRGQGTASAAEPEPDDGPLIVEDGPEGHPIVRAAGELATLVDLALPHATLRIGPDIHHLLVFDLPDPRRAALGVSRHEVVVDGWRFELDVESDARARLRERATNARGDTARGGRAEVRAIIPGRVVSVDVAEGDAVEAGGRLLVLEAMKMQNELRAPRAGTVASVEIAPGQTVELGDVLVVLE